MITAVDTSVLLSIAKRETDASDWVDVLVDAREAGELVMGDVVAAEYFAVLLNEDKFRESLVAGSIFKQYRREGGPREHLIPDFLIGAHAQLQADRIAAIDRGYLRRYFPRLRVVKPR